MPRFILAGHQRGLSRLVNEAIAQAQAANRLGGWDALTFHSPFPNRSVLEIAQVAAVLEAAGTNDGGHVFGVSTDRKRVQVERQIRPYFRFRWVSHSAIALTGQREFEPLIAELEQAVAEEQVWIDNVKPQSTASPLALPGKLFKAKGNFANLWDRCEAYGDIEAIRAAGVMVGKFTTTFRKSIGSNKDEKTPWLDDDDWIWKDDGEQHGAAIFPKNWKYSWEVPEKFHFDVMPKTPKRKKHFIDVNGVSHKLPKESKYMNITVHGEVRGYKSA
ncbi:MAG: hypothetical protein ACYCSN_05550 [Acidobacteriaceae bacterium]